MELPARSTPRQVAGVCAGLSCAYGWDLRAVRIFFLLFAGVAAPLYVVLWALMPPPSAAR